MKVGSNLKEQMESDDMLARLRGGKRRQYSFCPFSNCGRCFPFAFYSGIEQKKPGDSWLKCCDQLFQHAGNEVEITLLPRVRFDLRAPAIRPVRDALSSRGQEGQGHQM